MMFSDYYKFGTKLALTQTGLVKEAFIADLSKYVSKAPWWSLPVKGILGGGSAGAAVGTAHGLYSLSDKILNPPLFGGDPAADAVAAQRQFTRDAGYGVVGGAGLGGLALLLKLLTRKG